MCKNFYKCLLPFIINEILGSEKDIKIPYAHSALPVFKFTLGISNTKGYFYYDKNASFHMSDFYL